MLPDPITPTAAGTIGYVLKMYPRHSETFVVSEILAREAAGEQIVIFSMRPPVDPHFHPELARVQAPVIYLDRPSRTSTAWEMLRSAATSQVLPGMAAHLGEVLAASADDAVQAVALAAAAREHQVTHLHAHFATMATTIARLASLITTIPYSFTAHAKDIFHTDVDPSDLATKLRDAHHAITVSDYNLTHLTSSYRPHSRQLHRVYNGIELSRFGFTPRPARSGELKIVSVGRLIEKKGFGLLIDAVAALVHDRLPVRLDLIGGGPLREELLDQIDRLGVAAVVHLHGPQPQDEVARWLRSSDVFVAPFVVGSDGNVDGLPTVLLEAMATGIPCVAADVTGVPEVIIDRRTGLLVPTGDRVALVSALRRVAAPDFEAGPLVRAARALVESSFDSRRQAAVLRSLVGATGPVVEPVMPRVPTAAPVQEMVA